ncbi:uncharacterized protein LOC119405504 [Rhipicephalus sanguineus]|uniref:uncharacterized protein LOC119405504 n=1 Tax=Rhipicephalus sanguineus TaxID=34632 RepID=UPI0020C1C939|nr:uncharacterized protein LOC119405504 [Rhipicephalus sanguineus]
MRFPKFLALFVSAMPVLSVTAQGPSQDEIKSLPGLSVKPTFKQYSGFLNAGRNRRLHYWFAASQTKKASLDPVVIWVNAGPGSCSSMLTLMMEHGPFRPTDNGLRLVPNDFSWNKESNDTLSEFSASTRTAGVAPSIFSHEPSLGGLPLNDDPMHYFFPHTAPTWATLWCTRSVANVLFLDAPVGSGYSYDVTGSYTTDDEQAADDTYLAIMDFYHKFSLYGSNDVFIAGQGQAATHVTLVVERLLEEPTVKLMGYAINNGSVGRAFQEEWSNVLWLLSRALWTETVEEADY